MLAIERQNKILANLQINQTALVSELSKEYSVTEETIRRDLEKLEKRGLIKKTYGGAVFGRDVGLDIPIRSRESVNQEENMYIAKLAATQIKDGETLMLDSSDISLYTARLLKQRIDLTIITNSVEMLMNFAFVKSVNVISTGGVLQKNDYILAGAGAEYALKGFHVDKVILSCSAIHRDYGLTEANEQEAHIKRLMVGSAKQIIVAASSNKFDNVSFVNFLDVSRMHTLITNEPPSLPWRDFLKQNQIELIV
ncbi:MAG: DeoR/GlpR family DNA-binding transcription regulator [Clostridiales bacterium]|nr:DeoR/GlpR family DNA-binding transcription regulator [Clostridiales bacterium]